MSGMRIFGLGCLLGGAAILIAATSVAQQGQPPILPATDSSVPGAIFTSPASRAVSSAPSHGGANSSSNSAPSGKENPGAATAVNSAGAVRDKAALLVEGEKRFATNCGRCHQSPHHFPPRMMATVVRHMRVRATITDEDMRLILRYLTQ